MDRSINWFLLRRLFGDYHRAGASDVAADPELNPWEVMKAASYGQNLRSCYVKNAKTFSPAELFHLATVAAPPSSENSEIGQLRKGFVADCALWDTADLHPYNSQLPRDPDELVSLLIYRGARLEAAKVWVAGHGVLSEPGVWQPERGQSLANVWKRILSPRR
jgi:predicted amidohydrolase YtcJ